MKAIGEFDVNLRALDAYGRGKDGIKLGRMSIDKSFRGDLVGTSIGEMLSAMTTVKGSAGYVAIEQVNGILAGRKGNFVLQHFGTMDKGVSNLILEVVPDSGSSQLAGLSGSMTIKLDEGRHYYEFDYELPD